MTPATCAPIAGSSPPASLTDAAGYWSVPASTAADRTCSVHHDSLAVDPCLEDHGASQLIGVARNRIAIDGNDVGRAAGGERERFAESGSCAIREDRQCAIRKKALTSGNACPVSGQGHPLPRIGRLNRTI